MKAIQWKNLLAAVWIWHAVCASGAIARTDLFATDSTSIFRLRDINGDGDALDPQENVLWSNLVLAPTQLTPLSAGVLTNNAAASGELLLLRDVNGDGDALDVGEANPWFSDPIAFSFLDLASSGSTVYAIAGVGGDVYRLLDHNGDGDAQDSGEFALFASGFLAAAGLDVQGNELLLGDAGTGEVYSVRDKNGDGDALDVGERLLHSIPGFAFGSVIQTASTNSYFMSDPTTFTIDRATDRNGDGDALDTVEVLTYADPNPEGIALLGPMAIGSTGSLLAAGIQWGTNGLFELTDQNGDGDAFDVAETRLYAEIPIVWDVISVECRPGDFDCDDDVDGRDFLIWQRGGSPSPLSETDLADWRAHYGTSSLAATSFAVPEPAALTGLLVISVCLMGCVRYREA